MSIIFNALAMNNIWVLLSNFLLVILFVVVQYSSNVSVLKFWFDLSVIIKCVSCYDPCYLYFLIVLRCMIGGWLVVESFVLANVCGVSIVVNDYIGICALMCRDVFSIVDGNI